MSYVPTLNWSFKYLHWIKYLNWRLPQFINIYPNSALHILCPLKLGDLHQTLKYIFKLWLWTMYDCTLCDGWVTDWVEKLCFYHGCRHNNNIIIMNNNNNIIIIIVNLAINYQWCQDEAVRFYTIRWDSFEYLQSCDAILWVCLVVTYIKCVCCTVMISR